MEIIDGDHPSGKKNLDYVIRILKNDAQIPLLAKVFGSCSDTPDLQQIFSKHSLRITEFVQRCYGFDEFFTKDNVAALTKAAGLDEIIEAHRAVQGLIGD